jgi:hypothetical protein
MVVEKYFMYVLKNKYGGEIFEDMILRKSLK